MTKKKLNLICIYILIKYLLLRARDEEESDERTGGKKENRGLGFLFLSFVSIFFPKVILSYISHFVNAYFETRPPNHSISISPSNPKLSKISPYFTKSELGIQFQQFLVYERLNCKYHNLMGSFQNRDLRKDFYMKFPFSYPCI